MQTVPYQQKEQRREKAGSDGERYKISCGFQG